MKKPWLFMKISRHAYRRAKKRGRGSSYVCNNLVCWLRK